MTAAATIRACKRNFSRHGIPMRVCSDNGKNFDCKEFRDFAREWEFEHVTSSPYHQQANGKAESAVKIAKRLIKKSNESGKDLWFCILHWRNTPNYHNSSPAQRLFSRRTRTSIPTASINLKPQIVPLVTEKIHNQRQKNKFYYDKKTRELPTLKLGQPVAVQLSLEREKIWTKGVVDKILSDRSYDVNVDGAVYRRDIVHIKPFQPKEETTVIHPHINAPTPTPEETVSNLQNETPQQPKQQALDQINNVVDFSNIVVAPNNVVVHPSNVVVNPNRVASHSTTNSSSTLSQAAIRPKRSSKMPSKYNDFHVYK